MKTRKRYDGCMVALALLLGAALLLATPAWASAVMNDGRYRDSGAGYGGDLEVTVTIRGGKITDVAAKPRTDAKEEKLQEALAGLKPALIEQNGVDGVDTVSGATKSSQGILEAVRGVLEQAATGGAGDTGGGVGADTGAGETPAASPEATPLPVGEIRYHGLGSVANLRVGPGKDEAGAQVYSFNIAFASVLFDPDGRIADAEVDVYEVATPNYDGASMPRFSGWPGQSGLNVTDTQTGKVTGTSQSTEASALDEVAAWRTKRERGDAYGMNPDNDWHRQMDAYESFMVGRTVAELRAWFQTSTSQRNGRPLREDSDNADDQAALEALDAPARALLADVVSSATMSLSDAHGHLLEAMEKAWENRKEVRGR